MLSILIPVYNYDLRHLVDILVRQCDLTTETYEIIVMDDASDTTCVTLNSEINKYKEVQYIPLKENIGRAAIRNQLASLSKGSFLLYIDADCIPMRKDFIATYFSLIPQCFNKIIVGGLVYNSAPPINIDQLLHWNYGTKREAISAQQRNIHPSWFVHTSNILLPKIVIENVNFDTSIDGYGYEDLVWGSEIEKSGTKITHIDNPVIHQGLKSTNNYLEHVKHASQNLAQLYSKSKLTDTRLISTYNNLRLIGLQYVLTFLGRPLEKNLIKQLSHRPRRLYLLDLLKLYYFANYVKSNNN